MKSIKKINDLSPTIHQKVYQHFCIVEYIPNIAHHMWLLIQELLWQENLTKEQLSA